ncbi:hypothetical protein COCON_G00017310 [Conger conger]|uniref:Uncharacterized protein n=1 Tax=Conger conger TaxID=82655 RepID=A0A9Q1E3M4_CONCO|nr:hypothetical protein COCON_G00017310 [Conger conger]
MVAEACPLFPVLSRLLPHSQELSPGLWSIAEGDGTGSGKGGSANPIIRAPPPWHLSATALHHAPRKAGQGVARHACGERVQSGVGPLCGPPKSRVTRVAEPRIQAAASPDVPRYSSPFLGTERHRGPCMAASALSPN